MKFKELPIGALFQFAADVQYFGDKARTFKRTSNAIYRAESGEIYVGFPDAKVTNVVRKDVQA